MDCGPLRPIPMGVIKKGVDMDRKPGLVVDIVIGAGQSFSFKLDEDEDDEETEGAILK
jgi:hypothetical protein